MQKTKLTSLFIFVYSLSFGVSISKIDTNTLLKTTTIVVTANSNDMATIALKKVLTKEWTKTPLKYITKFELTNSISEYTNNPKYSFFVLKNKKTKFSKTRNLCLQMDILTNEKENILDDDICKSWTDIHMNSYTYQAEFTKDIMIIKLSVFHADTYINHLDKWGRYGKEAPKFLATTPVYVCNEVAKEFTQEEIEKKYKGKVQIIDRYELSKAIIEKRKNFYYYDHYTTSLTSSFGFIIDASTGAPIFATYGVGASSFNNAVGTLMSFGPAIKKSMKQ